MVDQLDEWRQSAHLFGAVLAAVSDGVLIGNRRGEVISCNAQAEQILGLTTGQLRSHEPPPTGWSLVQQDGTPLDPAQSPGMRAIATGTPVRNVPLRVHLPDGTLRWIEVSAEPLPAHEGGRPVGVVVAVTDVTARQHALEESRVNESRLEAVFEDSEHGSFDWDLTRDLIVRSRRIYDLLGYLPREIGPRSEDWLALVHPDDLEHVRSGWEEARAGADGYVREYRVRRRDGTWVWVHASARVVRRSPTGVPQQITGTTRNVTELREALEALKAERDRRAQLEHELAQARGERPLAPVRVGTR